MLCEKCGAQIPDGSQSCPVCFQSDPASSQTPVTVVSAMPEYAAPKKDIVFILRMILCGIGIIAGLYLIICACVGEEAFQSYDFMDHLGYASYGGDFYTDIYYAGRSIHKNTAFTAWLLTLVSGIGLTLGFGLKMLTCIDQKKRAKN